MTSTDVVENGNAVSAFDAGTRDPGHWVADSFPVPTHFLLKYDERSREVLWNVEGGGVVGKEQEKVGMLFDFFRSPFPWCKRSHQILFRSLWEQDRLCCAIGNWPFTLTNDAFPRLEV